MPQVSIHEGPYESIPPTASPGLQFLKQFLPAVDSLDPASHPIAPFIHPNARVYAGSNPPSKGADVVALLDVRSRHLQRFHHDVHQAWDMADGGHRTVMFEATSGTVFRNDPDQFEVRVEEFNIVELEETREEGHDGVWTRFQVMEMRTYMDARPVQSQAARLKRESAYGEGTVVG